MPIRYRHVESPCPERLCPKERRAGENNETPQRGEAETEVDAEIIKEEPLEIPQVRREREG